MTGNAIIPGAKLLYLTAAVCFLLAAVVAGPGKRTRPAVIPAAAGFLLVSIHAGLLILIIHRLPLIGGYEALAVLVWTSAGLLLARRRFRDDRGMLMVFGTALTLLCIAGGLARLEINYDYFMYASFLSQGFFFFKQLSAGLLLAVMLALIASVITGRPEFDRRLFMAAAIAFLGSELSGSIWGLLGWGDSWHWSANFFESGMVFFIFLTNLHLPVFPGRRNLWRIPFQLASAMIITGLFLW